MDRNSAHWQAELYGFRNQLKRKLTTNLRNYLQEIYSEIYKDALGYVKRKTQFKVDFPEECPYTLEQLLEQNYLF